MFYWLLKYIFMGPILQLMGRPKVEGLENIRRPGRRSWPETISPWWTASFSRWSARAG